MNTDFLDVAGAPDADTVMRALQAVDLGGADVYPLPADDEDQTGLVELSVRHPDETVQRTAVLAAYEHLASTTSWALHAIDGTTDATLALRR